MSCRFSVVLMAVLMLAGAQGCSGLRAFVVAELGEELGYHFRDLDAKTKRLQADIERLQEEAERSNGKVAILTKMATEVEDQLASSKDALHSMEGSVEEFEDKIRELSRSPLEEGETQEDREEKIEHFEKELHFHKGRLAATKTFLQELERTVDITNERLREQAASAE